MRLTGWLIILAIILLGGGGTWVWWEIKKSRGVAAPPPTTGRVAATPAPANSRPEVFVSPVSGSWANVLTDYEQWVRIQLQKKLAPGVAIAIVQDTAVLFLKGFGYRNTSSLDTVDARTVFRLGSVSKSITGTLAARLVQTNVVQWDDPVNKYVPGFQLQSPVQTSQTTLRHVLSHTVGLPYHAFTDRVDVGAPIDTLIYHLRDLPLVGKAGQVYSYQNVAFSVLAKVFEEANQRPFDQVLATQLFEPLHMWDASATQQAIEANPNHALPHRFLFRKWMPMHISHTYYNVAPAGGVNASISDMAQWLRSLTTHAPGFLDSTTKQQMLAPYVRATARNHNFRKWKRPRKSYYSMGWRVLTFPGDTLYYHGGYVNGFRSEVAYYPAARIGIAVLVNAPGSLADHALPEFFYRFEKQKMLSSGIRKAK
jgi:beta-lactamase class C